MKIKWALRLMALMLMIAMASASLVPISFFTKDKLLKYLIEQIGAQVDDIKYFFTKKTT